MGAAVDLEHPEALPATFERLGVEHLLLTLGERGMALIASDGVIKRIPTTARDVYDVGGCWRHGDGVSRDVARRRGDGVRGGGRRELRGGRRSRESSARRR